MKEPLKVGDRVVVYGGDLTEGKWHNGYCGAIREIRDGQLYVRLDDYEHDRAFHPKQCRRLKPRAKAREWWIRFDRYKSALSIAPGPAYLKQDDEEVVHVREVLPRKSK